MLARFIHQSEYRVGGRSRLRRIAPTFIFNNFQIPPAQPSICNSPIFISLQIPFPATPFFSHLYKTPGVWQSRRFFGGRRGALLPPNLKFLLSNVSLADPSAPARAPWRACLPWRPAGCHLLLSFWPLVTRHSLPAVAAHSPLLERGKSVGASGGFAAMDSSSG